VALITSPETCAGPDVIIGPLLEISELMASPQDEEAQLEALWRAHYGSVLRYAQRRAPAEVALEIAVEVFAVAWRRLADVPDEPRPWLLGVARRLLANRRRSDERYARLLSRLRERGGAFAEPPPVADGPLREALGKLTPREREALLLVNWDGLSGADAARVCGCSLTAFRVRLHRARRRLSSALESIERGTNASDATVEGAADEAP
jgi:RNA polymerase sigma-70 factor (ECF subfamily)